MSRRAAIVVCGCLLALLAITARAAAELFAAADPHPFDDGHRRVVGRGQIAFDGAGPERWAMRWRRQRRLVLQLRNELLAYRRPRKAVLSHYAGWLCIHSREGAWGSQTGNGYYGGLQMSYGWAGRVTNAALLSPAAQIAAADAEAREHGYSYSWMQGQWPRTFPPCAGLFR